MKKGTLKSLLFAVFCGFYAITAFAATSLFSDYGQIQNVQNYSSNPFWTPNAPYNQRIPQPVYVQGADLNTEDCTRVVQSLVYAQCAARDNCKNTTLADIRPTIMVQLSNLPGNNYVSACAGYLDGIFESYVAQYGNALPTHSVAFPTAIAPNPNVNNNDGNVQIQNPYKQQAPQWQQEIKERSQELQELQRQNGADSYNLSATDFPTTYADLSFSERMNLASQDYAKYKDMNAYQGLNVKGESEWCEDGAHYNTPECASYKAKKEAEAATQAAAQNIDAVSEQNEKKPVSDMQGIDYILPWFGILVVKKGSLDDYYTKDKPLISSTYMKEHKDKFFPANSDRLLGLRKGCTHGNHTAHDKDVINQAAHITMDEQDSFFKGNDYYVYDGEDVYWGTAVLVGEIALALITFGVSAEVEGGLTGAKVSKDVLDVGKAVKSVEIAKNTKKVQDAAKAASAITRTSSAADKAAAIAKLEQAGIKVTNKVGYAQLNKIGQILSAANQNTGWVSALVRGSKWRMLKNGAKKIGPTTKQIFTRGASFGRTLAIGALAYGGVKAADSFSNKAHNLFVSFLKANGYSSSSTTITDDPRFKDIKFNSFGLLSADDIEGHENDVSHGTWLQFDTVGEIDSGDENTPGDAEAEATRFAQEFAEDVRKINKETPLCDIDIFVVRPVIGDPFNQGKKDVYYILYTDPTVSDKPLRVESK